MKHFKSLSAAASAGLLALSMVGMPVFAEGETTASYDSTIPFNTTVTETEVKAGVTLPENVKFNYWVEKNQNTMATDILGTGGTFASLKDKVSTKINSSTNPANSLAIPVEPLTNEFQVDIISGNVSEKKETNNQNVEEVKGHFYGSTMNIKLDQNSIKTPGYYFFELKENNHQVGSTTTEVDGVDKDDDQKVIVVVMLTHPEIKGEDGNSTGEYDLDTYVVGQVIWYEYTTSNELNKIYDTVDGHVEGGNQNNSYFVADYKTYPLTIEKLVTGNLGDKTKRFDINYSISSNTAYEKQLPLTYEGTTGSISSLTNTGDKDYKVQLTHGQSVTIHGLAAVDTVKVWETFKVENTEEQDANADGYTVTYTLTPKDGNETPINTQGVFTNKKNGNKADADTIGKQNEDDTQNLLSKEYTVTVKNDKTGGPITGIVHNYGPFALMAAVGAALIGFFFRRRREE